MSIYLNQLPRVAIFLNLGSSVNRDLCYGIIQYAKIHGPWWLRFFPSDYDRLKLTDFESWAADGWIVDVQSDEMMQIVCDKNIPTVLNNPLAKYLVPGCPLEKFPRFQGNSSLMGEMAAEFFLERRYSHFAYLRETENSFWSQQREESFQKRLARDGGEIEIYQPAFLSDKGQRIDYDTMSRINIRALSEWLRSLHKPTALFAVNDFYASQVVDACREAQIRVPEDIAVLGCDNDQLLCEKTFPSLSSIARNDKEGGFQVAKLLHRLIQKEEPQERVILIEPTAIIQRHSTFYYDIHDSVLLQAIIFIHVNSDRNIGVADVVNELQVSRRFLETRFRSLLGSSIHDVIKRQRLERVKNFLVDTQMSVREIAENCHFSSESYLRYFFKKETGQTINQVRL